MRSGFGTIDVDDLGGAYRLNHFCRRVGLDREFAEAVRRNPASMVSGYGLSLEQAEHLLTGNVAALYLDGVHPVLLARLASAEVVGVDETSYSNAIRSLLDQFTEGEQ